MVIFAGSTGAAHPITDACRGPANQRVGVWDHAVLLQNHIWNATQWWVDLLVQEPLSRNPRHAFLFDKGLVINYGDVRGYKMGKYG